MGRMAWTIANVRPIACAKLFPSCAFEPFSLHLLDLGNDVDAISAQSQLQCLRVHKKQCITGFLRTGAMAKENTSETDDGETELFKTIDEMPATHCDMGKHLMASSPKGPWAQNDGKTICFA